MRITNKLGLPQAFVNAVSLERHNEKGCYSATTLNKGIKEIILMDRHFDEITVDVADLVWTVWGTAVHSIFENQQDDNFKEEFFDCKVSNSTVTGRVDSYDLENAILYDWKTASTWKVKFADYADWKRQGLTYAWLMAKNGLAVKQCRFVALLKDHSKSKARLETEYPQSPAYVYSFDVTAADLEETEKRILAKIPEIEKAETLPDDEIPPCTAEERWADPDKYAVMKNGRKSAVRVFDTKEDADNCAADLGAGHYVEHRPAVSRKCADYCQCKEFCNFYKDMKNAEN